jgi:hypothetical protein
MRGKGHKLPHRQGKREGVHSQDQPLVSPEGAGAGGRGVWVFGLSDYGACGSPGTPSAHRTCPEHPEHPQTSGTSCICTSACSNAWGESVTLWTAGS